MDPVKGGRKRRGTRAQAGDAPRADPVAAEGSAEYWTAEQAAQRLGVKRETLYAYASRGLLRSERGPHGPARRYLRADVERLHARTQGRREDRPSGGLLLARGEPILDSAICWLGDAGPFYRGHSAVALARMGRSFEAVAELLWSAPLRADEPRWSGEPQGMDELVALVPPGTPVLAALALCTSALAVRDLDRFHLQRAALLERGRRLIRALAACVALPVDPARVPAALAEPTVAGILARALGLRASGAVQATLDRVLVLLAEHELNASAFAARITASTRADLYACVAAGFAALSGPAHGGASEQAHALLREIGRPEHALERIREKLRLGERIPGFGHAVYRGPDPRAGPLLEAARSIAPASREVQVAEAVIEAMAAAGRPAMNVDLALGALAAALRLRPGMTPALFGVARVAGLVAHIAEQYESPAIQFRPRARYREESGRGG